MTTRRRPSSSTRSRAAFWTRKSWSSGLRLLDLPAAHGGDLRLINGFGVELLYGLTAGCVLSLLFFCKSLGGVKALENCLRGLQQRDLPLHHHRCVVGVGKVVSATDVFALVQENIINLPLPGLVKVAAITTIIAGITGSASGGLTIALELFGETFISWGYTPEIIHRVASIACGGLDTLPWNGTVVMLFALSGVSYKKGYKHVAMETVILPLLSLILYYLLFHRTLRKSC